MAEKKQIVLGVTGSIAAYKAAALLRLFQQREWEVAVIMTEAATRFVSALTFRTLSRRPVAVDMFAEADEWVPGHISWADGADVLVIAPCTAKVLAKLACGIADDMLTCTALATRAPLVIAPAMNVNMWEHPATQANVATLKRRGAQVVEVGRGDLACGYEGQGRLADLGDIVAAVTDALERTPNAERRTGRTQA